jgi:GNAT superfamily N-acetyltransferase
MAYNLFVLPLTPERWLDLEELFGPRGATGGCWCMWFRIKRSQFEEQKGEGNRLALKTIVDSGEIPGLIAYQMDEGTMVPGKPIGWISIAPREAFPVLDRSRIAKRMDDQPVWSIVCFYVSKTHRGKGVTVKLLKAAVDYARCQGAKIIEGYPVDPKKDKAPDVFLYQGTASSFREAGFVEVERRSETRPFMRYHL